MGVGVTMFKICLCFCTNAFMAGPLDGRFINSITFWAYICLSLAVKIQNYPDRRRFLSLA